MAEEVKEKLLEAEEVRQRIEKLRVSVNEMAAYIGIDDRRRRLSELEAQQAGADFWNDQATDAVGCPSWRPSRPARTSGTTRRRRRT